MVKRTDPQHSDSVTDWFSIEAYARKYPEHLTVGTLRHQVRHRRENGLDAAVIRLGKRLMINDRLYSAWLATRAGASP